MRVSNWFDADLDMWLGLVPVAAFVIAFLVGAVALWAIAKTSTNSLYCKGFLDNENGCCK
ncbi:MAG TPA: hypothetical protein VGU90_07290 [Terriglobales bacterium]|jgi:hypothetical protein|nr:hypothetical protein [Terriglobales bacterium]